jgi:predicted alpha/beta superfamily hydrolase
VTGHSPPLVVGIGYAGEADFDVPARRRDYTPGDADAAPEAGEGGADRFLAFIEDELKPLIATRYLIDRGRQALFGHSFGGLFVAHVLLTRPAAFSTYLASSPSLWWQDRRLFGGLPGLARSGVTPRVQVSVGALEDDPPKGNYPPEVRAMMAGRTMIPEARSLAGQLASLPGWAGRVVYHELAGEDHGPVWLPAMTRGMQFFLEQP